MEQPNDQTESFLRCPLCRSELADAPGGTRCTGGGHTFGVQDGLPLLVETMPELPEEDHRVFGVNYEPLRYVWLMLLLTAASKVWIPAERRRVIQSLALRPGDRVLDHCAGSGGDYDAIWSMIGPQGKLVAMDLFRPYVASGPATGAAPGHSGGRPRGRCHGAAVRGWVL
ncbi:MAG: hypothetical protein QGH42_08705 [Kiritimatiellia bacterium]|jgi:hypothetical protein|nr:hypothetical protein [Kiritimatiellia bacterium]MDP6630456.1 hypothetical protein [Kiritimatiellia bacterium]MDP6809913.1 hypothetical protein [Kiritimatiellia bacterium]MDP7024305.1 hypothetical protein [Kiritimatiellia bacterium]